MKFLVGKKVAMTQLWKGDTLVPVTKVEAGPCIVTQIKTETQDGYSAVQVGYGKRRASLITKPLRGHFKNLGDFRFVKEFRVSSAEQKDLKVGDMITVKTFAAGDRLTVMGVSKGKGFQGVVKRHGFHGQDATHGNKDQLRMSGSVGAGGIQHVLKGMRMGGRMGGDQVTLHDVEVVEVNQTDNSLLIKGAVPGARNGLILLSAQGDLILGETETAPEEVVASEEVKAEETKPEDDKTEETETSEAVEEQVEEVVEEKNENTAEPVATTENNETSEVLVEEAEPSVSAEEPVVAEATPAEVSTEETTEADSNKETASS